MDQYAFILFFWWAALMGGICLGVYPLIKMLFRVYGRSSSQGHAWFRPRLPKEEARRDVRGPEGWTYVDKASRFAVMEQTKGIAVDAWVRRRARLVIGLILGASCYLGVFLILPKFLEDSANPIPGPLARVVAACFGLLASFGCILVVIHLSVRLRKNLEENLHLLLTGQLRSQEAKDRRSEVDSALDNGVKDTMTKTVHDHPSYRTVAQVEVETAIDKLRQQNAQYEANRLANHSPLLPAFMDEKVRASYCASGPLLRVFLYVCPMLVIASVCVFLVAGLLINGQVLGLSLGESTYAHKELLGGLFWASAAGVGPAVGIALVWLSRLRLLRLWRIQGP